MVTTITVGIFKDSLKIRFANGSTRYYKTINKQLIGKFSPSDWDDRNKKIKPKVKHSNENNATITSIVRQYEDFLAAHIDIDPLSLCHCLDKKQSSIATALDLEKFLKRYFSVKIGAIPIQYHRCLRGQNRKLLFKLILTRTAEPYGMGDIGTE